MQKRLKSGLYDDIYSFSSSKYEGEIIEQVVPLMSTHEDVTDLISKGTDSRKRRAWWTLMGMITLLVKLPENFIGNYLFVKRIGHIYRSLIF